MARRERGEKSEKEEKSQEKTGEKRWEEKWQRDPLNVITWAVILIWAGLVQLADNLNLLPAMRYLKTWSVFFIGAGIILLLQVLIRLIVPHYRRPVGGTIILAFIFLGIGLGDMIGWSIVWPLVLIAIGLSIILRGLLRRR